LRNSAGPDSGLEVAAAFWRLGNPERADGFAGHHLRQAIFRSALGPNDRRIEFGDQDRYGFRKARTAGAQERHNSSKPRTSTDNPSHMPAIVAFRQRWPHKQVHPPTQPPPCGPEFARNNYRIFPLRGRAQSRGSTKCGGDEARENVVALLGKGSLDSWGDMASCGF